MFYASVEADDVLLVGRNDIVIELRDLPRQQAFLDLLGKLIGVGRGDDSFARQNARGLMMSVAVARGAGKTCRDHVRLKLADAAHQVGERDLMAAPFLERLVRSLGESEIGDSGKALRDAVVAAGLEQ